MEIEKLYKLKKDFEDPKGKIHNGVIKTETQWMQRLGLNEGDCGFKKDWFERFTEPSFNHNDMVNFAIYIINILEHDTLNFTWAMDILIDWQEKNNKTII